MGIDLRKRRKELGYSVQELAEKSGLGIGTIKNMEAKKHKPRRDTLKLVLDALDLDITCDKYYLEEYREDSNLEEDVLDENVKNKLVKADKLFDYEDYKLDSFITQCECLGKLSRIKEALRAFEKAVEIEESGEIYYNMGVYCHEENDLDKAIKYYEKSIELLPDSFSSYSNLAICYFRKFKIEEGMKYAKKAIEINPHRYQAYATLGSCYKELGKYKEAVENYKKCLAIDDKNYEALYGIFITLSRLVNKKENDENYQQVNQYRKEAEFYSEKFFRIYGDKLLGNDVDSHIKSLDKFIRKI